MIRRLFTILAIVSLLLCTFITAICIISYFRDVHFSIKDSKQTFSVTSTHGQFQLIWSIYEPLSPSETPPVRPRFFGTIDWPAIGIEAVYVPRTKDPSHYKGANSILIFPCWFGALMTGLLPMIWLGSKMQKRIGANRCAVCDYDLRATPNRCPECGRVQ